MTEMDASFISPNEGRKCNVFADTITIKVPSESTMGAHSISEDVTPPGAGTPPHKHTREVEAFIVLEGEYEFQCGDHKFKGSKGAMVVLPKEIPHAFAHVTSRVFVSGIRSNSFAHYNTLLVATTHEDALEDLKKEQNPTLQTIQGNLKAYIFEISPFDLELKYGIVAMAVGILFIVLSLFFPLNLNCVFLVGGGNQSCPPANIERHFTLNLECPTSRMGVRFANPRNAGAFQ